MSMDNLEKLIKILGYTASNNDNEALNACRRANELMKKLNLTWEKIVMDKTIVVNEIVSANSPPIAASPKSSPSHSQGTKTQVQMEIEAMLQALMSRTNFPRLNQTGRAFISSINDFYQRNGRLTDKQIEALRRWYNNV